MLSLRTHQSGVTLMETARAITVTSTLMVTATRTVLSKHQKLSRVCVSYPRKLGTPRTSFCTPDPKPMTMGRQITY